MITAQKSFRVATGNPNGVRQCIERGGRTWAPVPYQDSKLLCIFHDCEEKVGEFPAFGVIAVLPDRGPRAKAIANHLKKLLNRHPIPDEILALPE